MKSEHKDVLITERVKLVENVNVRDGLYSEIISRKLLSRRQVDRIKRTGPPDEQCEELLDVLMKCGEDAFDKFCEALKSDCQDHVVEEILTPALNSLPIATNCPSSNDNSQPCLRQQSSVQETLKSPDAGELDHPKSVQHCSMPPQSVPSLTESAVAVDPRSSPETEADSFQFARSQYQIDNSREILPNRSVSYQEEFQHQTFRRSVHPNDEPSFVSPSIQYPAQSESEARFIYQHILGPGARKPQTSSFNFSVMEDFQPVKGFGDFQTSPGLSKGNPEFSSKLSDPFHGSPLKSGKNSPFNFVTQNSQSPKRDLHGTVREPPIPVRPSERHQEPSTLQGNITVPQAGSSQSPYRVSVPSNERSSMEIPRYIEVEGQNGSGPSSSQHRDVRYIPRHVECLYPSADSRLRVQRNDSVDTMHTLKRIRDNEEADSVKRPCHIVQDPIPDLVSPESLTTLQLYNKMDNEVISIPVIDETIRRPARPMITIDSQPSLISPMEDLDMDSPDGPINVNVDLCSRQFFMNHYKQAYAMHRIPRGKALILNVNEVVGKSPRRGTDIDRDNLHNLLAQFHFDVTVYNDTDGLTAKDMVLKLQEFSRHPDHKMADSTVVCILSHGEEGYIFGSDGKKFELEAVFSLFDNLRCQSLIGKPKIFIIQACRGGALDNGISYNEDEHDGSDIRKKQVPSMSDMLICYPTQHGYYAWRNRDRGSWYVEALVQVFMKYAKCEDMCTMLNRVNLLVSRKVSHCTHVDMDQMSQMSEYKSTLRMPHLYLFPGIGSKTV